MSELQFSKQFLTTLDNKPTKYQPDHAFDPKTFATRVPYTLPKLSSPPHPSIPLPAPAILSSTVDPSASTNTTAPSSQLITLTLRSNRNPSMSLNLPSLPLSTEVSTIKTAIQTYLGGPSTVSSSDKIKIILNKKPIPSSKRTLADAFADTPDLTSSQDGNETEVKLSVMVMGGAPDPSADAPTIVHLNSPSASDPTATSQAQEPNTQVGPGSEKAAAEKLAADAGGMEGVLPSGPSAANMSNPDESSRAADEELGKQEFWADLQAFLAQRLKSEEKAEELRRNWEGAWRARGGP